MILAEGLPVSYIFQWRHVLPSILHLPLLTIHFLLSNNPLNIHPKEHHNHTRHLIEPPQTRLIQDLPATLQRQIMDSKGQTILFYLMQHNGTNQTRCHELL